MTSAKISLSPFSANDHAHMARALQLAERGAYTTKPNPLVGCVLADGDRVLGEGWHVRAGQAHAEANALREAGHAALGATAYVTLEPCAHQGRTPPCADALVAAGVTRVVAAVRDPFYQVAGQGFAKLQAAGITVETGLMEAQARALNRGFFSRVERGRPWLRLKLAMSLDGRTALANGESRWISSEAARADVQHWRARAGAILTGIGTIVADDPQLTVRLQTNDDFEPPVRVVLDDHGRLPHDCRLLNDGLAPTIAIHGEDVVPDYSDDVPAFAVRRNNDGLDLAAVLAQLAQRGLGEVQVEAGATLAGAFLKAGLVDELLLYVAPVLLGDRGRPLFAGLDPASMAERVGLQLVETVHVGPDLRLRLLPD